MCLVCSYKVDAFVYEMHVSAATCCLLFVELQMLQMLCSSRASLTATNVGGVQITWHSHFAFSLASRTLKVCAHLWHFHNVVLSLVIFSVANQCLDLTYRLFFMSVWNMLELQFELYLYPLPHPSSSPYLQTGLMFISGRPSALLIRLLAFLLFLRRPSFPSLCCSSLSSSFLISIFSLVELSCKLYMLVWQYGAVNSCWCTHSYSSHYSRKLPVSVLCVSVQRVMMFRTALKMDRCLHCRTDAQSLPPPVFPASPRNFRSISFCSGLPATYSSYYSCFSKPIFFTLATFSIFTLPYISPTFAFFPEVLLRFHHLKLSPCPSHFYNASHLSWLFPFAAGSSEMSNNPSKL